MIYVVIGIVIILVLMGLYTLSTRCRKGHPGLRKLRSWAYAHRGLHDGTHPENSLSALRAAVGQGYGVEVDVHLLRDGNLAVIHDSSLLRTTGAEGQIEQLDSQDLWNYHLEGTAELIPTFREVLDVINGRVPMIIELKVVGDNYKALCEAVCRRLEHYKGVYCIESFDPRCVRWFRENRPDIIRGQLVENYFKSKAKISWILKVLLTCQMMNFLTLPDFVAYKFDDRKHFSNLLVKKIWGAARVSWVITDKTQYQIARREGWMPIFENFKP